MSRKSKLNPRENKQSTVEDYETSTDQMTMKIAELSLPTMIRSTSPQMNGKLQGSNRVSGTKLPAKTAYTSSISVLKSLAQIKSLPKFKEAVKYVWNKI